MFWPPECCCCALFTFSAIKIENCIIFSDTTCSLMVLYKANFLNRKNKKNDIMPKAIHFNTLGKF